MPTGISHASSLYFVGPAWEVATECAPDLRAPKIEVHGVDDIGNVRGQRLEAVLRESGKVDLLVAPSAVVLDRVRQRRPGKQRSVAGCDGGEVDDRTAPLAARHWGK